MPSAPGRPRPRQARAASIAADGQIGAGTDSAAQAFQAAHGLGVDGQVGPQAWETLVGDWVRPGSDWVRPGSD